MIRLEQGTVKARVRVEGASGIEVTALEKHRSYGGDDLEGSIRECGSPGS